MSAYLSWFYSVHLRQYYQEPSGILISQVSYSLSAPSSVLLQSNYFHLFKGYLINHHQILGLCTLILPLSPVFLLSAFAASDPDLLYHLISLEIKSGSQYFLQELNIFYIVTALSMRFRKGLMPKVFFQLLLFALGICNEWQIMFAFYGIHC